MNEELILKLIKNKIKNSKLTYKEFDNVFDILSHKEQYEVCNILSRNGIELVDFCSEEEDVVVIDGDLVNDEKIIEDDDLFKDNIDYDSDYDLSFSNNKEIKQSNEILCILIQQGNAQAKQDLCIKNKFLVAKYAYHYKGFFGSKMSVDDLMQEGYVGLLKAAGRFDVSLHNTFTTYAVWWIKQCISRAVMDFGFMIRIPVHMMERIGKVTKLDCIYEMHGLDYDKRMFEISKELGIKVEDVEKCLTYRTIYLNSSSLDVPIDEKGNSQLIDFIEDKDTMSPDEYVNNRLLKDEINTVLQGLTQREEKVLRLRFGLDDGRIRTLEEVGKEFNVTRERIRQIEAKALRKLKHPTRSKKLVDFMEV